MYKIARVGLHHFEEPCLSGTRGSGTIFFPVATCVVYFVKILRFHTAGKGLKYQKNNLSIACSISKISERTISIS